ncbi:MAG: hypothetical protein Cons2KO_02410 [Congregibacter sp.]
MARYFIFVLLAIKCVLILWGLSGFVEYYVPSVEFGLQDSNFPQGVQFLHWLLIVLTGSVFVVGYMRRWKHTAFVSITLYATLATLCFVETVDFEAFGGGTKRFFIMALEYASYIGLATYLTRSQVVRQRFGSSE